MTIGRWLLIGFPLVVMGVIWLYCGVALENKQPDITLMVTVGCSYLLSGLVAASNKPWCRNIAKIAWYPLLLLIPIGTVLGILALRILRDDPEEVRRFHESVKTLSPEEMASIVSREAISRFGIQETDFGDSLVGSLRISPGEVNGFIDDLEADYGFRLADKVRPSTTSVLDIINVLSKK